MIKYFATIAWLIYGYYGFLYAAHCRNGVHILACLGGFMMFGTYVGWLWQRDKKNKRT